MKDNPINAIEYFFTNLDRYIFYNPSNDYVDKCDDIFSKTSEPLFEFLSDEFFDLFWDTYGSIPEEKNDEYDDEYEVLKFLGDNQYYLEREKKKEEYEKYMKELREEMEEEWKSARKYAKKYPNRWLI